MKKRIAAVLLGLCVVAFAVQQAEGQVTAGLSAEDQKQIDELRQGVVKAFNARDVDSMLRYVEPDVVVVWQNAEVNGGQQAVRDFYNRMIVQGVVKSVSFNPTVEGRNCHDNTCVSYGNLQDEFTLNDGTVLPLHSRFSAALTKTGGTWKLASFHASTNVFDNPVVHQAAHKTGIYAGVGGVLLGLVLGLLLFRRPRKA
jgi:ketosteroid isomerase-like protein